MNDKKKKRYLGYTPDKYDPNAVSNIGDKFTVNGDGVPQAVAGDPNYAPPKGSIHYTVEDKAPAQGVEQKTSRPAGFTFAHTPSPVGGNHHTMLPGASDRINSTLNPLLNPNKPASSPIPGIQVDGTALYDYYRDLYERQGRLAKEDAEGKVAAATGGQASSYADTAGGQTYDAYLAEYDAILRGLAGDQETENTDNWYSEMFGEGEPAFTGTSKAEAEAYLASLDIPADALAELIPPAKWARLKRAGGEAAETQFNSYAEYLSAFVEYVLDTYEG